MTEAGRRIDELMNGRTEVFVGGPHVPQTERKRPMDDKPKTSEIVEALGVATQELATLQATYDDRKAAEDAARRETTIAVNALNQKQREVDALMADLREVGDGDWKSDRQRRYVQPIPR